MGITVLTPSLVRQLVRDQEMELRSGLLAPDAVAQVFRYGAVVGSEIQSFASLDRGMAYTKQLIHDYEQADRSFASGTVVVAGQLADGQGRFGRYWHAPPGGVWMTVAFANTLLPETTRLYPLAAGLACCEAIRHFGVDAQLKWVNDVHVGGKKIAGILAETVIGPRHGEEYILLGLGVNVNNDDFPPELADLALSMRSLLGYSLDLDLFAARLLAKLSWSIGLLHYEEGERLQGEDGSGRIESESLLVRMWRAASDTVGRKVLFGYDVQKNPQYEAMVEGITADGGLRLSHLADKVSVVEYSGEIVYLD